MVTYLAVLLIAIFCIGLTDYRYKLIVFADWRRALKVWLMSLIFFVLWDIAGIGLHIFYVGNSTDLTGVRLWHELPIEELFFLTLLIYTALVLWRILGVKWPRI